MTDTLYLFSLPSVRAVRTRLARGLVRVLQAEQRYREARQMSKLDARLLRDIGITQQQAENEIQRLLGRQRDMRGPMF